MLPRSKRISTQEFQRVFCSGRLLADTYFTVRYANNARQSAAFSVSVGNKVEKTAVGRNTLKRKAGAALEAVLKMAPVPPFSAIFFVKKEVAAASHDDLVRSISSLIGRFRVQLAE
jgi:ribonuclease P protein component